MLSIGVSLQDAVMGRAYSMIGRSLCTVMDRCRPKVRGRVAYPKHQRTRELPYLYKCELNHEMLEESGGGIMNSCFKKRFV